MKQYLPIIALTAVAAFSCNRETVEGKGDKAPSRIGFATQLTRGNTITDPASLAEKGGFNVWAFSHAAKWSENPAKTPLLDGTHVTGTVSGSDIIWDYGTQIDWPENEYVSFFAYGPAESATVSGTTIDGIPAIDFTVATSPQQQTDLLIATPVYDQTGPMYSNSKPVGIFFNHALSRIVFSGLLLNSDDQRVIKVKEVVLNNLYNKGSTSLSYPPSWIVDQAMADSYTMSISTGELNDISISTTAQKISSDNGNLFLMPQTIARDTGEDPAISVTLEIDGVDVSYSSIVFTPDELIPGKSYDYQLIVDGDDLKIIVLDSDISLLEWSVYIMIQPVPLTDNQTKDLTRINSALSSLAFMNNDTGGDLSVEECKYFALYLKNDVNHDITIDMASFTSQFTTGETVMFDAKKIVGTWGNDGDETSPTNYTFTVTFDSNDWELGAAAQPTPTPDAVTYATTNAPSNSIQNKGSVILVRK